LDTMHVRGTVGGFTRYIYDAKKKKIQIVLLIFGSLGRRIVFDWLS